MGLETLEDFERRYWASSSKVCCAAIVATERREMTPSAPNRHVILVLFLVLVLISPWIKMAWRQAALIVRPSAGSLHAGSFRPSYGPALFAKELPEAPW